MDRGLISVDRFGDNEASRAYFLTHLHADHTRGLTSGWSRGPLFLSQTSAALLPSRFAGFDVSLLRPIPAGATVEVEIAAGSDGASDDISFLVTAVDAHHCPGSIMFLFRGKFGCMLYTGDFRWESESQRTAAAKKSLFDALEGNSVDFLYLDNTYCHPSFLFPPRDVASRQVVDIIKENPEADVVIGVDTLGKEELLIYISEALGIKIWVWPERLETTDLLGYADTFTTRTCLTRVRAVPRYSITYDTLETLNLMQPTIAIMPTGLPWKLKECKDPSKPLKLVGQYFYSVPYSEHSCFSEIVEFVKLVKPSKIIGIVRSSFCNVDPCNYFDQEGRVRDIPHHAPKESEDAKSRISIPRRRRVFSKQKAHERSVAFRKRVLRISGIAHLRSRISMKRRQQRGAKIEETGDVYEFQEVACQRTERTKGSPITNIH